jgi:hypothetical protein
MGRFLCSVVVVVGGIGPNAVPASAAPDDDFVVGTGEIVVSPPGLPPAVLGVFVDAPVTQRGDARAEPSTSSCRATPRSSLAR